MGRSRCWCGGDHPLVDTYFSNGWRLFGLAHYADGEGWRVEGMICLPNGKVIRKVLVEGAER